MKRLTVLAVVGCVVVIAVAVQFTLNTSQTLAAPTPDEVAQQGLSSWLDSVRNSPDIRVFGFKDASELAQVSLGEPYPVLVLSDQNVRDYQSNQKVRDIARSLSRFDYLLTVNGEARGFLTVEHFEGEWKVVALGGFTVSDKLLLYNQQRGSDDSKVYLLEVPTLHGTFALREKDGLEQMALLASYPGLMPELDSQGATEYNVDLVLAAIQQAIAERAAAQPPPADR